MGILTQTHNGLNFLGTETYIQADGSTVMTIKSDGNVGIGTTEPDAKLDVAGTSPVIRITNTINPLGAANVGSLEFFTKDTSVGASRVISSIVCVNAADSPSVPDGQLVFKTSVGGAGATDATEKMRIDSAGNVGIGTNNPGNLLHIQSASSGFSGTYDSRYRSIIEADGEAYYATYVPDNSFSGIRFNNTSGLRAYIDYYHGTQGEYMLFSSQDSHRFTIGTSEKLRISSNGSLDFKAYGAGGFKGDATYVLGVDSSGNVVETTTAGVYFGTNTSNGTYTNQWQKVLVIDTGNFDSQVFRLRIEGTGNTSGQSIVAEIEFNYKNQNGTIRARTTVNSYGTSPVDKDDVAVYFDTTNLEATFYFKVKENYTTPIYSIVSGRIRNYAFYSNVIGDDTALASETNDSITSNLKFQGIVQDQDSGYVGIGTSAPGVNLEVSGEIKATYDSTHNVQIQSNASGGVVKGNGGNGFMFRSYGDSFINGGDVGIGTSNPKTKLTVADDAPNSTLTAGNAVLDVYGTAATARTDDSSLDILRLHRNNDATPSKASTFAIGLSFYEDPGNNYPRTRADFKTTGRTTDDSDVALTVMSIVDTGRVGIGTTNPTAKLNIGSAYNDAFVLTDGRTAANTSTFDSSIVWDAFYADAAKITLTHNDYNTANRRLHFDIGGNELMSIKANGNVGIGTDDPAEKLHIGSGTVPAATLDGVLLTLGTGQYYQASDGTKNIFMGVDASSYGIVGMLTNHDLGFRTNNTERLRIKTNGTIQFKSYGAGFLQTDANGNITAGTVTTSDTLDDVTDNGNSTTNGITVGSVTSTGGGEMQGADLYFKNGGDDGAGTRLSNVWYSVSTGGGSAPVGVYESAVITTVANGTHGRSDLVFKTKDNDTANFGSSSERMRITKAGNVGIGTSPSSRLTVSSSTANNVANFKSTDTLAYIAIADNSSTSDLDNQIGVIGDNMYFATADVERIRITSGGYIGIGTTNPATLLHLGKATNGANIISFGEASVGGPHGLDFYGDDATRTKKFSIYYRTGTENISIEDGGGTKRWEISQAGAVTFNQAFTFPTADGSAGAALITNGSGALSWNSGYKQYSPVGWTILNNQTYTSTGANISSSSTQAQAGTTPVQRNSATEFEATKQGWYEISYSFLVKNNYTNRAMIGAYMTVSTSSGGGVVPGSHSTQYVRYNTYGEYAQIQNTFYYYTAAASTDFYLLAYLLSGSMNMTTQSINQRMISFRYINNDIT